MNPIVVLGMHRSGTSALTGVFNRLGFSAGTKLLPANQFNARGYFENENLNQLLDKFLSELDRTWHDERLLPANWLLRDVTSETVEAIKVLLAEEYDLNQPTIIKNPRICRLLPLLNIVWQSTGQTPYYIFSLRSPFAVIRSLEQRDSLPPHRAALLYAAHLLEAELHSRNQPRVFIKYDDLLQDWRLTISNIEAGLDLNSLSVAANESERAKNIDAFLSATLNHFVNDQPVPTGIAVDLAVEVFNLLEKPLDKETLQALDDLRGRWLKYLYMLEPWLSEAATLNLLRKEFHKSIFNPSSAMADEACLHSKSDVYWSSIEQDYTEDRKVSAEWRYGQRITQRFAMSTITEKLSGLRWDITDRPAFCLIDKVWLEDSENIIVWSWNSKESLFGPMSIDMHDIGLNERGQLQIISSGFDPHAPILIPDAILELITDGWSLFAEWQASLPTQEIGHLMRSFSNTRNLMITSDATLASVITESEILREETDQQGKHLAHLEQQQQKMREEIIKAEAQLSFLKDLWREVDSNEKL
jgi:hypothetical protein